MLITGATGEVATAVIPLLEPHFSLRLLSLSPGTDPRFVQADLLDLPSLPPALNGIDAILHLAVAPGHSGTYEEDGFNDLRFDVNVKGTYHLFEAARRAGIKRVVHVSSLMVVWGHDHRAMVPGDAIARPVGTYALTKMLGEQIAEHYARVYELEVVTLRIAAPLDIDDPDLSDKVIRPQQVPFPDLAQAFQKALTVRLSGYHLAIIVGESSRRLWDLEPAKRILGYEPTVRLDDLNPKWGEPFDVKP